MSGICSERIRPPGRGRASSSCSGFSLLVVGTSSAVPAYIVVQSTTRCQRTYRLYWPKEKPAPLNQRNRLGWPNSYARSLATRSAVKGFESLTLEDLSGLALQRTIRAGSLQETCGLNLEFRCSERKDPYHLIRA